jgi:hypothetical protein
MFCVFFTSFIRAVCLTHPTLVVTLFREEYEAWISLCLLSHPYVLSYFIGRNILLSTLFSMKIVIFWIMTSCSLVGRYPEEEVNVFKRLLTTSKITGRQNPEDHDYTIFTALKNFDLKHTMFFCYPGRPSFIPAPRPYIKNRQNYL